MSDLPVHRAVPRLVGPDAPGAAALLPALACPAQAHDLALAAEHVLAVYQRHHQRVMASPDWSERDRAAFEMLGRTVTAFWSRKPEGA